MRTIVIILILAPCCFFSCTSNKDDKNSKINNDTVSVDSMLTNDDVPGFNEFLALFEEFVFDDEPQIVCPLPEYFYTNKPLKDRVIPDNYLAFIDFNAKEFKEFSNEINLFDESLKEKTPFYALLRFKAFDNCHSVIIYSRLDAIEGVRSPCAYYFLITFNNEGDILSIFPLASSFGDNVNHLWEETYAHIYAERITCVNQNYHMRHTWQKEYISEYEIQKDGTIKQSGKSKEYLDTFSKEWTIITKGEKGDKYIEYECYASPVKFILKKEDSEYFINAIWGQEGDMYEVLAFQSEPNNTSTYTLIVENVNDRGKEIEVTISYDSPEKVSALWTGLYGDGYADFATKEYIESGSIRVIKPECDEEP